MPNLVQAKPLNILSQKQYLKIQNKFEKEQIQIEDLSKGLIIGHKNRVFKIKEFSTEAFTAIVAFNQTQFEGFISLPHENNKYLCISCTIQNDEIIRINNKAPNTFVINHLQKGTLCQADNPADLELSEKTKQQAFDWFEGINQQCKEKYKWPDEMRIPAKALLSTNSTAKTYLNTFFKLFCGLALLAGIYAIYRLAQGRFLNLNIGK